MHKLYIPRESEDESPGESTAAAKILFRLSNAMGFDLNWEWMEENPEGEFLRRADVLAVVSEYLQQDDTEVLGVDQIRRLAQSHAAKKQPQEALAAIRRLAAEILGKPIDSFATFENAESEHFDPHQLSRTIENILMRHDPPPCTVCGKHPTVAYDPAENDGQGITSLRHTCGGETWYGAPVDWKARCAENLLRKAFLGLRLRDIKKSAVP